MQNERAVWYNDPASARDDPTLHGTRTGTARGILWFITEVIILIRAKLDLLNILKIS